MIRLSNNTEKIKVAISGRSGFIGTHLSNFLFKVNGNKFEEVVCTRESFYNTDKLTNVLEEADVFVHLAGVNRANNGEDIYEKNMQITSALLATLNNIDSDLHIIFASSTHEDRNTDFGKSKKRSRELLGTWAKNTGKRFTGIVIPNIFGSFCKPFYNSVVATFSHQLINNETPKIMKDSRLYFMYIDTLINHFVEFIVTKSNVDKIYLRADADVYISDILRKLNYFKEEYIGKCIIPVFSNDFDKNLFNTFRSYVNLENASLTPEVHTDDRGWLTELVRTNIGGQAFVSKTVPGITRGNHFHTRKIERFCVISGDAKIKMRRVDSDKVYEYDIKDGCPTIIDIPIWYTHNITNTGETDMVAIFWCNEFFNKENPDTFFEEV